MDDSDESLDLLSEYWTALGRFIHEFAVIEAEFQRLLWSEANVPPQTARAVFSGVKVDQSRQLMRRVWEANGIACPDILARAFEQMGHLNSARNDIVHFGAKFSEGETLKVSNDRIAHVERARREIPISPAILDAMTYDLCTIHDCITWHRYGEPEGQFRELREHLRESALAPWRYKPLQQAGGDRKPPKKPRSRQSPPPSSQP